MTQIEARKLEMEKVVPDFILPSVAGKQVSPRDFKQKSNLVIVYLDLQKCGKCVDFLRELADNYHVYRELETEILAVSPQPVSDLQGRAGIMGIPFPLLSDEQGQVGRAYLGAQAIPNAMGGVFVTDRFGALRAMMIAQTENDLPNQQSILDWLSLIEMECPECGPGAPSFQQ
ncbi:MAG: peroxiredoxin family protein [Sphingomonadaceae bacterium]